MASSKLTLIGLYNYYELLEDHLFDNLTLPTGIDKDLVISTILLRGGEFEVLYSDGDFLKAAIKPWSDKWFRTFKKWQEALNIEYNPLENYDRKEDWIDINKSQNDHKSNAVDMYQGVNDSEVNNKVSAFNSSTMEPNTSQKSDITNKNNAVTSANAKSEDTSNNLRKGRAHGNIGITTSQQMLESELDIASWNLYNHIADIFLREFIIPVY